MISAAAGQGLLGADVTLVHPSGLDDADIDAIASSGASVSLAPSSEMAAGHGTPPIQQLIDHDIRPGLGIDNERISPGDMFAQMRATISMQHATVFDLKLAGKGGVPHLMGTRDVIRHATVDGARVAGLGRVTGSLEPGMQADVIVLRTDRPNVFPINDPIGAVVWGMDTSNVDWVFVGGRALMRGGVLQADVQRARDLASRPGNGCSPRPVSWSACRREVIDEQRPGGPRRRRSHRSWWRPATCRCTSRCALLVIVASIWAPATLSGVALRAIAPYGAVLAIAALGQMLVIMTGGIDLSVPGTMSAGRGDHGRRGGRSERAHLGGRRHRPRRAVVVGLANGILIGGLGLNALIVTLAVGLVVVGW